MREGIEVGAVVEVDETESPWIFGKWRGIVTKLFENADGRRQGDLRVRPTGVVTYKLPSKPGESCIQAGLYLTALDKVEKVSDIEALRERLIEVDAKIARLPIAQTMMDPTIFARESATLTEERNHIIGQIHDEMD